MKEIATAIHLKSYHFSPGYVRETFRKRDSQYSWVKVNLTDEILERVIQDTKLKLPDYMEWDEENSELICKSSKILKIWDELDFHVNLDFFDRTLKETISEIIMIAK